jgi:hypothetical protein
MISKEDCIAFSGLTPAEVEAIEEHEHCGDIAAAVLGRYVLQQSHGPERLRDMVVDDIRAALHRHDTAHAKELMCALRQLLIEHPGLRVLRHPGTATA